MFISKKQANISFNAAYQYGLKKGKQAGVIELAKSLKNELENHKHSTKRVCHHCRALHAAINLIGRNI